MQFVTIKAQITYNNANILVLCLSLYVILMASILRIL